MSQEEAVEQITKIPPRFLAEYNKQAKEALKREKEREALEREKKKKSDGESETIGSSAQYVAVCLIGVGLTAINLFSRY